jgi:hypothetical protein
MHSLVVNKNDGGALTRKKIIELVLNCRFSKELLNYRLVALIIVVFLVATEFREAEKDSFGAPEVPCRQGRHGEAIGEQKWIDLSSGKLFGKINGSKEFKKIEFTFLPPS